MKGRSVKQDLLELTIEEMKQFAAALGEKPYRGKQVFGWIYRGAASFGEMTDLPKAFREKLQANAEIGNLHLLRVQEDRTDGTRKFLFGLGREEEAEGSDAPGASGAADAPDASGAADAPDASGVADAPEVSGAADAPEVSGAVDAPGPLSIESVFMKYSYGNTLCVSTQVGCKMGCKFCASALGGFVRDLTAGEMMGQVLEAERQTGEPVSHIVLMGMGESFENYENVSRFLHLMHEPAGKNMSWRHMTVSTSGIIPGMERFAEEFPQVNLAISLHRIDDAGRSQIMPVNRKYPVKDLLAAARRIAEKTGRRITFEYALIRGENDRPQDVKLLQEALQGMLCHVNLIPLNEVAETGLKGTGRQRAREIAEQLEQAGVPATVRRELGSEINGACGQLRLRHGSES